MMPYAAVNYCASSVPLKRQQKVDARCGAQLKCV
jgi:hypothetical protein